MSISYTLQPESEEDLKKVPDTIFYTEHIILVILVAINLYAFLVMALDKRKAVQNAKRKRAPESYLFFLAAAFGSVGVYLGMQLFRHKTKKWYFQLGMPLLILQNLAMLYVGYSFL